MKIQTSRYAFTLVELIIAITIIAILSTISFISLTGYTQLAKNSKISSDLRALISVIETELARGEITLNEVVEIPYLSHSVDNNAATFGSVSFGGSGVVIDETSNYSVGSINFTKLKQNPSDFHFSLQDKIKRQYLSAYVKSGNYARYQIGGSAISVNGEYKSIIKGSYKNEGGPLDVNGLISESGALHGILSDQILLSGILNPSIKTIPSSTDGGTGGAGHLAGTPGAVNPYMVWTALPSNFTIGLPESIAYNVFEVDPSANNTHIFIDVGNNNTTITTQQGNDHIAAGYGNNLINSSNGDNIITVGDGYNEIHDGYHNSTITVGNGDNIITSQGGSVTINTGNGDNTITLGYGNTLTINIGDGDNTIVGTGGGALKLSMGGGDNTITANGYGNHNITFSNGNNIFSGAGGDSILTTGTSGSANITFGGNQSQQLIWRGGDVVLNDYWRWGNNSISFTQVSDLNNCADVLNNTILSGSVAIISSIHGTLEVHIQEGQTDYNCIEKMIF